MIPTKKPRPDSGCPWVDHECIIRLIERSKEVPVLYERDAKELIIRYFREFQYNLESNDTRRN